MSVIKFPSAQEPRRTHRLSGLEREELLDRRSNRRMRELFGYTLFGLFLFILLLPFLASVFPALDIGIITATGSISPLAKTAALITTGFIIVLRSLFKK